MDEGVAFEDERLEIAGLAAVGPEAAFDEAGGSGRRRADDDAAMPGQARRRIVSPVMDERLAFEDEGLEVSWLAAVGAERAFDEGGGAGGVAADNDAAMPGQARRRIVSPVMDEVVALEDERLEIP